MLDGFEVGVYWLLLFGFYSSSGGIFWKWSRGFGFNSLGISRVGVKCVAAEWVVERCGVGVAWFAFVVSTDI